MKWVLFAGQCIHEYVCVLVIHTLLKFIYISLWLAVCISVSDMRTHICKQNRNRNNFGSFHFPLFNHETGCFVALKPWFMLLLCQVHLHPQPFTIPPGPNTSCAWRGRKWGDAGTAHPYSEIQIHWLPYKAVSACSPLWTIFCVPSWLTKSNTIF